MESSVSILQGVVVTQLKRIHHPKGDIYHALKRTDSSFIEFGEAYFTSINKGDLKGWKKHTKMVMNLVVPVGVVGFYFHSEVENKTEFVEAGKNNYVRISVQPGIWMAFEGMNEDLNLVLNIASIQHDLTEAVNVGIETFSLN